MILATLRDASGVGPAGRWTATVKDGTSTVASEFFYDAPGNGSLALWLLPEAAPQLLQRYWLQVSDGSEPPLSATFQLPSFGVGLSPPRVDVDLASERLHWDAVPGAVTYLCRVTRDGVLQLSVETQVPECSIAALPEGTYDASVLALSADLAAVRASHEQAPPLSTQVDVAEGRAGFVRGADLASALEIHAVGGALHWGTSTPGLAVFLSLQGADGHGPIEDWEVTLVGPGLPPENPLRWRYPAGVRRFLTWSYDTAFAAGQYSLRASASGRTATSRFSLGEPRSLAAPSGLTATAANNGGAEVTWSGPSAARSYFVGAWARDSAGFAAGAWTSGSPYAFPSQTFAPGASYDVYVAATDVDMRSDEVPLQVTVSEDSYSPAPFVAR